MVDATTQFFEGLGSRGHEPLLEKVNGTVGVELENGKETERWLVSVHKGDVDVSRRKVKADCTLHARREVFDDLARGETNATAAFLRGALVVDGDWELLVLFQRLFPSPPSTIVGEKR
jgi:putative sterol carrier protein